MRLANSLILAVQTLLVASQHPPPLPPLSPPPPFACPPCASSCSSPHTTNLCSNPYWAQRFVAVENVSLADLCKYSYGGSLWYYNCESTCVGEGDDFLMCDNTTRFCPGVLMDRPGVYGYSEYQVKAVQAAIANGGVHTGCPVAPRVPPPAPPPPLPSVPAAWCHVMSHGDRLVEGQTLVNVHGDRLVMQTDGNLVWYLGETDHPINATATNGSPPRHFVFQDDGNAVVYDATTAIWASSWASTASDMFSPFLNRDQYCWGCVATGVKVCPPPVAPPPPPPPPPPLPPPPPPSAL